MVRVANLLDNTVDELYRAITTLDLAHRDGDRRDRLPLELVTETLQKIVSAIEDRRPDLGLIQSTMRVIREGAEEVSDVSLLYEAESIR